MGTVDAIAESIPPTNQAARQALSKGEAMQFYFGQPSYFVTVTPDDNNSFLIQTYNWEKSPETNLNSMSNAALKDLAKKRELLCIRCPGISAFMFEMILDIVFQSVIGWDRKNSN